MKTTTAAGFAVFALALAACGGGRRAVEIDPQAAATGDRWNATLATPAGLAGAIQLKGSAWMDANRRDTTQTRAHVVISNAAPGGVHPWHVHLGRCGNDQGILGSPTAYQPLQVGGKGEAEADATLALPVPASGQYFVSVHASPENLGTIVACGNLAPPSR